jgi:hypothetical protein
MFIKCDKYLVFMIADIEFYMAGGVEERLHQLTAPDSPLVLEIKIDDFYRFIARDAVLDGSFVYGAPDSEIMSEDPLHIEAQRDLGFQAGSNLHYGGCNLNPEKIAVFKGLMEYISAKGIPVYMTLTDESGDEALVVGHNPATKAKIQNPNFKQGLAGLLE